MSFPLILYVETLFSSLLNIILPLTEEVSKSCGCLKTINILRIFKTKSRLLIKQSWHPSASFSSDN